LERERKRKKNGACRGALCIAFLFNAVTNCAVTFPPNVIELTLTGIKCISDEGMNGLGNHTKLKFLRLLGKGIESQDFFDLNCVGGSFPQLEVFEIEYLALGRWKLDNGAMPRLESVIIHNCHRLDDLPNELWSLSGLRKVKVTKPSEQMALRLQNLINNRVKLIIG